MARQTTVGKYLVARLESLGVEHVFGVPGDYVLGFYDRLVESNLKVIGTCTEIGAGYAADAYARVNGLGAVCVTYCVGGLSMINAVAGAYAERSAMVVISGAPGMGERSSSPLLHHQVRDFTTQLEIYKHVTAAAVSIEDPAEAPRLIDEALQACYQHKQPVYIELPRDMVGQSCDAPGELALSIAPSNADALNELLDETASMLGEAKRPVILAGVDIHRFALQEKLVKLAEATGYPVAATLLGKSVISELHPQYIGVYEGAIGHDHVRRAVESADCLLVLGAALTDINLGIGTAKLDADRTIKIDARQATIRHHHYEDVAIGDVIAGLIRRKLPRSRTSDKATARPMQPFDPQPDQPVTMRRLFQRINHYLEDNDIVIADVGDSLFAAADLTIHKRTEFLSQAFYTSMGFAIPGAVGAQIRNRKLRPIVFVGDGAFQMTGHELSTVVRHGLNPIIFVFDNRGYTTERVIHEGPYNDVLTWAYHLWPVIVKDGFGCRVHTEGELEVALDRARRNVDCFTIINVALDKLDCSDALAELGSRLGQKVTASNDGRDGSGARADKPRRDAARKPTRSGA